MHIKISTISLMVSFALLGGTNQTYAQESKTSADDAVIDEVIVRGYASAQRKALEQQRNELAVANFVSADTIGKLPDNNIAESLARLPGLNVIRDQQTGEGARLSVRGLDGSLNTVSVNGVRQANANGDDRSVSLNFLPPEGIAGAVVRKTATPDIDGDFIGGSIDIKTPTIFDYNERYLSVGVESTLHQRSSSKGHQVNVSFAEFLNDNNSAGLFISALYGNKDIVAEETENEGDWQLYNWVENGQVTDVDPNSFMMQGLGLDLFENEVERVGVNASFDFKIGQHTQLYVRGQYNKYEDKQDHHYFDVRNYSTPRFEQVDRSATNLADPDSMVTGFNDNLGRIYGFTPAQIIDVDGDGIISDADRDVNSFYSMVGRSGVWDPEGVRLARGIEPRKDEGTLETYSIGGETISGNKTYRYSLSSSRGTTGRAYDYELGFDFRTRDAWLGNEGIYFSHPDSRYPQWQLNHTGLNGLYDLNTYQYDGVDNSSRETEDKKLIAQFDMDWHLNSDMLSTLKVGVKRSQSERQSNEWSARQEGDVTGSSLADFQELVRTTQYQDFFDGEYSGLHGMGIVFDADKTIDFLNGLNLGQLEVSTADNRQLDEDITAGYVMGVREFDNWQIFGGVRVERTEIESRVFLEDERAGDRFNTSESDYTNVLPSIHLNYRQGDNWVYRGAIWTSISRPEYQYISAGEEYGYDKDPDGDGADNAPSEWILAGISKGNPDLDPAEALNLDVGFEYYHGKTDMVSFNFFYKDIDNFIFLDNGVEESAQNDQGIAITQPKNGNTATIYGVELGVVQELNMLPSPFDGLGFSANLTLQESEAEPGISWRNDEPPFINAPDEIFNFQLYWEKGDWDVRASYAYTGRYLEDLRSNAVDKYIQPTGYLDLQVRYYLMDNMTLSLEVQNILEEHAYWATRGTNETYQKDYVESGRNFRLNFSWEL